MKWEDLVSAALVGTDRRAYPGDLLGDAALEVIRRRAGHPTPAPATAPSAVPGSGEEAVSSGEAHAPEGAAPPEGTAPPEEREAVPRKAADRLRRVLGGEQPRLLAEWLRLAAESGRRVPAHVLPDLLDRGDRDRSIREHLGLLAGHRGRWLAARNPAWAYLLDEPTGETWELGSSGDRRAYLKHLRESDPEAARTLVEATWTQETPDDRAAFLELFESGLSIADEPFLEQALDDRRREVRQQAANLLSRLPESRLARRMAARIEQAVRVGKHEITVTPPTECDRAMERDGIRAKAPAGTGARAWWLQQLVARAPLSVWPGPPAELLAKRIPDWDTELRLGWVRAAIVQRDPEWARAMFEWDPIADLLVALPPWEQQRLAAEFAERHELDNQLIMVLGGVEPPWGAGLAAAVLNKIVKMAAVQPWNLGELSRIAGERIDPALHHLAERASAEQAVQEVAALLRFRAEMREELS
ncbi:DUF5691 domain-containing protein [Nonomuraea sp. NPDC050328]|uniref:DUF5691 domain-containing protein n=1 Tax=Nonomuraea sp. NPDC050328 TaxID=3364361 RepID=UPI00379E3E88